MSDNEKESQTAAEVELGQENLENSGDPAEAAPAGTDAADAADAADATGASATADAEDIATTTGQSSPAPNKKKNSQAGKKVSEEILLKRKLGRIKAAENMAKKIKKSGIEKVENNLLNSTFRPVPLINQKNYYTDYLKKDDQITIIRQRKQLSNVKKGRRSNLDKQKDLKEKALKAEGKSGTPLDLDEDDDDDNDDDDEGTPAVGGGGTTGTTPADGASSDGTAAASATEVAEPGSTATAAENAEKAAKKLQTIVIHPGSRNIRIGFVNDAYPKTIPNVIAVPNHDPEYESKIELLPKRKISDSIKNSKKEQDETVLFGDSFNSAKKTVVRDFKERMRYYKRRILPNSNETVKNFNKKVQSEVILDLNDPHKIDWIDDNDDKVKNAKYLVGEEALKLAKQQKFRLRYPIKNGKFNEDEQDYQSPAELVGDIQIIITEILKKQLNVAHREFCNYNTVVIIPDLYDKGYVETWISLVLQMNFNAVSVLQESVAATFGAGVSQACVIDIGAQTTSISCIDEGMIINDSRVRLDYGGDDITNVFTKLLLQSNFPYSNINLSRSADLQLANNLKEKFTTFQDANVAIQLYDFTKRVPNEKTEKFQFKVFDEVMLSPMGLFYPELFQLDKPEEGSEKLKVKQLTNRIFPKSIDPYTGKPNNPTSLSFKNVLNNLLFTDQPDEEIVKQLILSKSEDMNPNNLNLKKNELSRDEELKVSTGKLDLAIIESIANACKNDLSNAKKFYENLLIVGGVAKTPSLDLILTDRINIWRPRILSISNIYEILKKINEEFLVKKQQLSESLSNSNNSTNGQGDANKAEKFDEESIKLLESVISKHLPKLVDSAPLSNTIEVLSPPRDLDPQILTWKGGAVFARLKIVQELWITQADWDLLGSRTLHYKVLFSY